MDSLVCPSSFHLKYCERCGGLWLRPDGAADPYCPACARFMAELPRRPLRHQDKAKVPRLPGAAVALLAVLLPCRLDVVLGGCA